MQLKDVYNKKSGQHLRLVQAISVIGPLIEVHVHYFIMSKIHM